jgi:hypothetical protein
MKIQVAAENIIYKFFALKLSLQYEFFIFNFQLISANANIVDGAEHNVDGRMGEIATPFQGDGLRVEVGAVVVQLEFHGIKQQQFHPVRNFLEKEQKVYGSGKIIIFFFALINRLPTFKCERKNIF